MNDTYEQAMDWALKMGMWDIVSFRFGKRPLIRRWEWIYQMIRNRYDAEAERIERLERLKR